MRRILLQTWIVATFAVAAVAAVGCGSASSTSTPPTAAEQNIAPARQAHAQAVQPAAGVQASASSGDGGSEIVGDPNAHAPPLSVIKRELNLLNLCGGTNNRALAAPLVKSSGPGFVPDPGTSQTQGQLPLLTARLDGLAKTLGVVIYGISGYRTPAHSVAVGG